MPFLKRNKNIYKIKNYSFNKIKSGNFQFISHKILPEETLKDISNQIKKGGNYGYFIHYLLKYIPKNNKNYDWNVASILQHLEQKVILEEFKKIKDKSLYYDSIGLTWLFGELGIKDSEIIDYLYSAIKHSTDSDAWWNSAFSLENLCIEEAVNLLKRSLKRDELKDLNFYLKDISNRKSVIALLVLSNLDNVEHIIYPKIKHIFITSKDKKVIINCCWIIGRFNLMDKEITKKLIRLIQDKDYEIRYYAFFALQNCANENLNPILSDALKNKDALIRKMACRTIRNLGNENMLLVLENSLYLEKDELVISELTKAIYHIKNPQSKNEFFLEQKSYKNENGLIIDESDKWYKDAAIYNMFSEAEDPQNVCFDMISKRIKDHKIFNPIDLATGTGRMLWQIINKLKFEGVLYAVDMSKDMCDFLEKNLKRGRKYTHEVKIINTSIEQAPKRIKTKSSFIISSFGFPSKISNRELCIRELKAVYSMLSEDGIFVTLGWDETFNDELSAFWFKYIPDNIHATNFEEWRRKRVGAIYSARNSHLTWFKKGMSIPLQFSSLKEAAIVIGYLFGRDAAQSAIQNNKVEWMMSLGITVDDRKSLKGIIRKYEKQS